MPKVICLNAGNYLGKGVEYVNALYRGVVRNSTVPLEFIVFTDELTPRYAKGIKQYLLPEGMMKGWWWKIWFFKAGLFERGERIVFLDLDTIITGNIDALLQFEGDFAILQDFMQPGVYGPGVMAWRADFMPEIWAEYDKQGRPTNFDLGDLTWINYIFKLRSYTPAVLQSFVNGVYSYKVDCRNGLPTDARIVCFHGLPRPHQVLTDCEWLGKHWHAEPATHWGQDGKGNS